MTSPAAPASRLPAGTSVLLAAVALAILPAPNLASFDVPKLAVLLAGVAVLSFAAARRDAERDEPLRDPLLLLPAALAAAALVAALTAWPRGSTAGPATALACVAAARLVRPGAEGVRSTLRAAAVTAGAVGAYAVAQALGLDPAPWGARREVVATLGNTSFAAEFQAAALPLAAALALSRNASRRDRVVGAAGVALAVTHLVLARSRIDVVAAAAGLVVLFAVRAPDPRRRRTLLAAGAVAGVLAAVAFAAAAQGTIAWLGRSDTLQVRAHVWASTLRLVADAPFRFGTAPFVATFPPYRSPEEYRISLGRTVDTPHADLLEIAATLGVVGVLVAGAFAALVVRRIAAARATAATETAALAGAAAALAVSGLASSPLTHPSTALVLALCVGHLVALAPRPLALPLRRRATGIAAAAAAVLLLWPGPALRALQADGFVAAGITAKHAGRPADALLPFDAAASADPQSFAARYETGTLLLALGKPEEAAAALASAAALRPDDPHARTNLYYALRDAGRAADADRVLDDALARVPWDPLLLTARASRSSARGDFASAARDLDRAAELRPFDLRVRAVRAEARLGAAPDEAARTEALDLLETLRAAGDASLLARAARSFAERDPVFPAVLATRARRIVGERPADAAALVVSPIAGLHPPDPGFFDAAAVVLAEAGHEDAAAALRGRALGLRARRAFDAGDVDGARRLALKAVQRDPLPDHRVLEALCLARQGERRAVAEALTAAAALGGFDAAAVRRDPAVAALLPDADVERALSQARPASRP